MVEADAAVAEVQVLDEVVQHTSIHNTKPTHHILIPSLITGLDGPILLVLIQQLRGNLDLHVKLVFLDNDHHNKHTIHQ